MPLGRGAARHAVHRLLGGPWDPRSPPSAPRSSTSSTTGPAEPGRGSSSRRPARRWTRPGLGPGFSGLPIYCSDAQRHAARHRGDLRVGRGLRRLVALATPIEAILGNPVDAPHGAGARRGAIARARPLAAPLTITGLSPSLGNERCRRGGQARPAGARGAGGAARLVPGPAAQAGRGVRRRLRVGRHRGERDRHRRLCGRRSGLGLRASARGVGARVLLLQDAYVFRVINNPVPFEQSPRPTSSRRPATTWARCQTTRSPRSSAGSEGCPRRSPCAPSRPTSTRAPGAQSCTHVADESAVDQPTGASIPALHGAARGHAGGGHGARGSPARLAARPASRSGCAGARRPVRFCNRYVSDTPHPGGPATWWPRRRAPTSSTRSR